MQCLLNRCQHQLCCGPWPHVAAKATCALSANCKTCCCTIVIVVHKGSKEDTQTHTQQYFCVLISHIITNQCKLVWCILQSLCMSSMHVYTTSIVPLLISPKV
jgi:hypothetical protein